MYLTYTEEVDEDGGEHDGAGRGEHGEDGDQGEEGVTRGGLRSLLAQHLYREGDFFFFYFSLSCFKGVRCSTHTYIFIEIFKKVFVFPVVYWTIW